ncbi:Calpain-2 catalytic subunit [Paragonimus heterotremus]|uniref:Calpain-2 catalytic subunit n=1 Tax=Paragonimus heterotremus TaxID=100268 RepID=A0A8J4SSP8_9TREM|nr:Calpain-2 catalytic subunit [Paragonimus heterotremus]
MGRITIVYAPDAESSGTSKRSTAASNNFGYLDTGRQVDVKRESPNDYLDILKPKKGQGRMEFNPYVPKTLTQKGYTKYKLMMSVASKQYETLIRHLQRERKLWEDPDFPTNDSSIGIPEMRGKLEWKRPREINPRAEFFVGGASRFDIEQGSVGDCWLLAVVSSISSYPQLFDHVVPKEQTLQDQQTYVGVFRVRFWRFGQWVEVLVDDRLPVYRGTTRLAFMHSADDSEFWSALLEKAYAKINGCYNNLSGGTQSEAMEDLTGGVCETLQLDPKNRPKDLLQMMLLYEKRCCLMGCSIDSQVIEAKMENGLIAGHAYSVTGVRWVTFQGRKQYLVRCRNPWGGNYEWKGDWADRSPLWNQVSAQEKKSLDVEFRDDGEFWMSYEDFITFFTRLEVCHLGLESLEHGQDFRGKRRLEESIFAGQWEKNVNAGGCINNRTSFWTNPQFRITITDPDPGDQDNLSTAIIGLMQRDVRRKSGADFLTIGFMLYEVDANQQTLLTQAQLLTKRAAGKSTFVNTREVAKCFRLPVGSYVVIPSTFEPNQEAHFIVRVLTEVAVKDRELDDDNTNQDVPDDVMDAVKLEDEILNEDSEIERKFDQLCDKKTNAINAVQLKELLNGSTLQDMPGFQGFNKEMCRSMVASVDHNLTGLVEKPEFMDLWQRAKAYKMIFLKYDVDQSGFFKANEFRDALKAAGYNVSNKLFNALVHRYEDPDTELMRFEDFMLCCVRLKNVFETVAAQPKTQEGAPMFNAEDYLRCSVYI